MNQTKLKEKQTHVITCTCARNIYFDQKLHFEIWFLFRFSHCVPYFILDIKFKLCTPKNVAMLVIRSPMHPLALNSHLKGVKKVRSAVHRRMANHLKRK